MACRGSRDPAYWPSARSASAGCRLRPISSPIRSSISCAVQPEARSSLARSSSSASRYSSRHGWCSAQTCWTRDNHRCGRSPGSWGSGPLPSSSRRRCSAATSTPTTCRADSSKPDQIRRPWGWGAFRAGSRTARTRCGPNRQPPTVRPSLLSSARWRPSPIRTLT